MGHPLAQMDGDDYACECGHRRESTSDIMRSIRESHTIDQESATLAEWLTRSQRKWAREAFEKM